MVNNISISEQVYYIMLSLVKANHGYGIMKEITELSNNTLSIGPGTLYGALNTLEKRRWIIALDQSNKTRKKEYILSNLGLEVLNNEINKYQELVLIAQSILNK